MTSKRPDFARTAALFGAAAALMLASGCSGGDPRALEQSDAAFKGQAGADGAIVPVASRPVMVGQDGRDADACGSMARPRGAQLTVHWSTDAAAPAKAEITGDVYVCESDGDWSGIIFPAEGQDSGSCNVASPVRSPREYQGPCRWGWVKNAEIAVTAG